MIRMLMIYCFARKMSPVIELGRDKNKIGIVLAKTRASAVLLLKRWTVSFFNPPQ
jgi:hypothetical protein